MIHTFLQESNEWNKGIERKTWKNHNILGCHLIKVVCDWLVVLVTISNLIDTEILLLSRTNLYVLTWQWGRQQISNCWAFYFWGESTLLLLVLHSLEFIWVISFSNLIARAMFPLIFNFPDINAMVGFNFPENILTKSSVAILITTSARSEGSPCPTFPPLLFRSRNHVPPSSPESSNW